MKFLGDYHTHTTYSHGKGSIEDNVKQADKIGLQQVAITDHGYRHLVYNVRRFDFKYMRRDIAEIADKYKTTVFLGLETNLQSNDGDVDIKDSDIENLDIILLGYHRLIHPASIKAFFSFYLDNKRPRHKKSDLRKGLNTEAYIKAINRFPIDAIVHPNHGAIIDVVTLAKECTKLGVFMELNGKRISMTDDEILAMAETGVGIIANSDAHIPDRVGDMSMPLNCINRLNLNSSQIVNLDKIPSFRSRKLKGLE